MIPYFYVAGNWVPLDEYYYGTMEGDAGYEEEKGEFRFKVGKVITTISNNKIK